MRKLQIKIPLVLFGFANIGIAVLIHEGSTLVVVFNALRLLAYKEGITTCLMK